MTTQLKKYYIVFEFKSEMFTMGGNIFVIFLFNKEKRK